MSAPLTPALYPSDAVAANGHGRILVVDDSETNRDMLSRRLQRRGYAVEVAEDGRRALELVTEHVFDLVLLDIMMPELTGYEVLERLKADAASAHLPVIMISAVDDLDSVIRCIELGADDYLPKPFNPTLLQARVEASLAKKRLYDRERLHAQSLERELEIARQIQQGFLPTELPQPPGWEIAARFKPARQVAGDFYDVFPLGPGRLGLIVADVCGKGVGAALFMALFRSLLRAHAQRASAGPKERRPNPEAVLLDAVWSTNGYIMTVHRPSHVFASVFFGLLEPETGHLRYVNAGHNPPLLLGRAGPRAHLATTGPALGVLPDATFDVETAVIGPGETLLTFTDGVTEARDAARAFFTEERLLALLHQPASTATDLLERIEAAVQAHVAGTVPSDDITLLAARRHGAA